MRQVTTGSAGTNARRNPRSSHYSDSLLPEGVTLAKEAAQFIKENIPVPVLVYSGMSGVAFATAIQVFLTEAGKPPFMIYVRKTNETSHGQQVESNLWG